jgi:DNA-directed RNA polymerase subunit N (RpoN/RPB10)
MIIPIRCFTCGKVLADKYDYYMMETKKLMKDGQDSEASVKKTDDAGNPNRNFDEIRTGPILDKLGLTRYCCRRHMIAHVDLINII